MPKRANEFMRINDVFLYAVSLRNLANRSNQFAVTVNHRFKTTRKMLAIERAPTQNG